METRAAEKGHRRRGGGRHRQVAAEIANGMAVEKTYDFPPITLLDQNRQDNYIEAGAELRTNAQRLADTLRSFGVDATGGDVIRGPAITRYEFVLDQGVKLSKITNLADDIALALGASGVRIAPIPEKISVVGIEVPNKTVSPVLIRDVIESRAFTQHKSSVAFAVGRDIGNKDIVGDIAKLPHVLIAGTTGSGKSVCTNSLIISLLYKSSPEDVRFIMVDPKMVELAPYNGIPPPADPCGHRSEEGRRGPPVGGIRDDEAVQDLLRAGCKEAGGVQRPGRPAGGSAPHGLCGGGHRRAGGPDAGGRQGGGGVHLPGGPDGPRRRDAPGHRHPAALRRRDHRPDEGQHPQPHRLRRGLLPGVRIILDTTGAEKLVGRGDMLYAPLGSGKPIRVQGCFITPEEIDRVVGYVKSTGEAQYSDEVMRKIEESLQEKEKKGGGGPASSASDGDEGGSEDEASVQPPLRWSWRPGRPPCPCSSAG